MKRYTFLFILLFAMFLILTGCSEPQYTYSLTPSDSNYSTQLRVVATIFPQYDFVRQIAGDKVELNMLLSPGMESHGFEPTPRDIIMINDADLFIYIGGHGDIWVDRILTSLERPDIRTVALIDLVDAVKGDLVEGMEPGHSHLHHDHGHSHSHNHHHDIDDDYDHGHDHDDDVDDHDHGHDHDHMHDHDDDVDDHDHGHDHTHGHGHDDSDDDDDDTHEHSHSHSHDHAHHHEPHYDEHVWTCPRNAILIVETLTDILAELDPANAEFFRNNAEAYIAELEKLDSAFAEVVANGARSTLVFGDRFPFRYLTDTYKLTYFAAFTGCSAETQASPATIAFLIQKVQEENIPVVLHIEFSNKFIANTIAEATGARLLEMHSLHNVSHADFSAGVTYLDLMRRNVETLREALN